MTQSPVPWSMIRRCRGAVGVMLFGILTSGTMPAGPLDNEAAVKAGCLFNFVRYSVWPPEVLPPGSPVGICAFGPSAVARSLEITFKGRKIENRPVIIRLLPDLTDTAGCHVLFLSGAPSRQMKTRLKSPRSASLLIVGDDDTFSAMGTLLDFSIEKGRVVFIANGETISRSRVRLSPSLLGLARFR